jgi:hypothetical protein
MRIYGYAYDAQGAVLMDMQIFASSWSDAMLQFETEYWRQRRSLKKLARIELKNADA